MLASSGQTFPAQILAIQEIIHKNLYLRLKTTQKFFSLETLHSAYLIEPAFIRWSPGRSTWETPARPPRPGVTDSSAVCWSVSPRPHRSDGTQRDTAEQLTRVPASSPHSWEVCSHPRPRWTPETRTGDCAGSQHCPPGWWWPPVCWRGGCDARAV